MEGITCVSCGDTKPVRSFYNESDEICRSCQINLVLSEKGNKKKGRQEYYKKNESYGHMPDDDWIYC